MALSTPSRLAQVRKKNILYHFFLLPVSSTCAKKIVSAAFPLFDFPGLMQQSKWKTLSMLLMLKKLEFQASHLRKFSLPVQQLLETGKLVFFWSYSHQRDSFLAKVKCR